MRAKAISVVLAVLVLAGGMGSAFAAPPTDKPSPNKTQPTLPDPAEGPPTDSPTATTSATPTSAPITGSSPTVAPTSEFEATPISEESGESGWWERVKSSFPEFSEWDIFDWDLFGGDDESETDLA